MEILMRETIRPRRVSGGPGVSPAGLRSCVMCRVAVAAQSTYQITHNILALPRGPDSSPTLSPSDETGAL